jgi:hypothetical protein
MLGQVDTKVSDISRSVDRLNIVLCNTLARYEKGERYQLINEKLGGDKRRRNHIDRGGIRITEGNPGRRRNEATENWI